ncbi:hypothetical protein LNA22_004681 [Salmonella enterica subsp. enterica serovar Bovismorbificans]|nr:hypothetical protein [Salmonella enterica subsp. enterica serovar Bovismorbificans]EIM4514618.1 hypothetical protein [Salmonella enterica subsp. enterica serovar Bovismorbificans]
MKQAQLTDHVNAFKHFLDNAGIKPGEQTDAWTARVYGSIGKVCESTTTHDGLFVAKAVGVALWDIAALVYVLNNGDLRPLEKSLHRLLAIKKWKNEHPESIAITLMPEAVLAIKAVRSCTARAQMERRLHLTTLFYQLARIVKMNGLIFDRVLQNGRISWTEELSSSPFYTKLKLKDILKG